MIGIKNNNGFFRISVAVIMLLSTLGLIRLSAQSHDTVTVIARHFMLSMAFSHMNSTLVTIEQGG